MLMPLLLLAAIPNCADATTQAGLNDCAAAHLRRADTALNVGWAEARKRMGGQGRAATLLKAQRSWIAYRDAQCAAETALSEGGSMHGMAVAECKAALTEARTRQLSRMGREDGTALDGAR